MESTVIKVESLSKEFGSFTAVDQLSFKVSKGEIFGFLGPNGAGKTTTIKMICGLLKPTSGLISIQVPDNTESKRASIGYCPQENIHWNKLSCREQLEFSASIYKIPPRVAKKRIDFLLEVMYLKDKAKWLASKLSGGMQRRLNICLALVHDPDVIIFDEPEAGLDPQSRAYVRDFIRNLTSQKTVILTTHNMDEAERLSSRVAIIDHGILLKDGKPEDLKKELGEGDILEVQITGNEKDILKAEELIKKDFQNYELVNNFFFLKGKDITLEINKLKNLLSSESIEAGEFKLRQNTLEDVFLSLTGRTLRQ